LGLTREAALAHAGLAYDRDEVRTPLAHHAPVERGDQSQLLAAADERRLAAAEHAPRRLRSHDAHGLPGIHAIGLALELERLERAVVNGVASGPVGALSHGHRPRATGRLEPRRHVHGVADHGVVAAHGAGQHLAGVHPDAKSEAHAVRLVEAGVDVRHRVLHAERGADGTLGVVLVRDRRAENRHHVVADVLVDGAAEALDLVAQAAQAALHEALDRLGIHLLRHRRVTRQVGEDDGYLAALLRERTRVLDPSARRFLNRRPAGHAEAGLRRQGGVTDGTATLERRPAGHAEASAIWVLVGAARTGLRHLESDDIAVCSGPA
jgi:hypothetical protein